MARSKALLELGTAAMMLAGLANTAGAGELMLYTSQPESDAAETVAAFEAANPDVTVQVFRSGTSDLLTKLAAEFAAGSPQAELKEEGSTQRSLRYTKGIEAFLPTPTKEFGDKGWPFAAVNQDLDNISWDGLSGVWQNATHHPHPDPISGMHCWHQKVLLEKAGPGDRIGDLKVDISATYATYQAWRDELTRPAPGPGGLRRPEHLKRPWVAITRDAYKMKTKA